MYKNCLIGILMLCLLSLAACKTTQSSTTDETADPGTESTQTEDSLTCAKECNEDCKVKWASSPMGYEYCFNKCLDICTQ